MNKKEIYLAAGCFWGVQKYFDYVQGVISTEVGYANGNPQKPTYAEVCTGQTGHAEAVRILYDADKIALGDILKLFFKLVDPTLLNRQGNDVGTQYRTGIYYTEKEDGPVIEAFVESQQPYYMEPIVTEVAELQNYYPAELYHQKYLEKNPQGYCHIGKIELGYAANYTPGFEM